MLEGLEKEAREARKGLWADPQPVPPWEWRKMSKATGRRPYGSRNCGENNRARQATAGERKRHEMHRTTTVGQSAVTL